MSAAKEHRLDGLEPDNLLAFMALLGLLRALEAAEPEWRPRAFWDETRQPLRPILNLAQTKTPEDVAAAAARGVRALSVSLQEICDFATSLEIDRCKRENAELEEKLNAAANQRPLTSKQKKDFEDKITKNSNRAKKLAESTDVLADLARSHGDLSEIFYSAGNQDGWVSVLSAEVVGAKGWSAQSTPLKFGSGQMPFVGSLVSLTRDACESEILKSLCGPWEFRHRGESLRLSPAELRLYALRATDPTEKEKRGRARLGSNEPETTGDGIAPSERGANSLAAVGFLSFPVFGALQKAVVPGEMHSQGAGFISWPLLCSAKPPGFSLRTMEAAIRVPDACSAHIIFMSARIVGENNEYKNVVLGRRIEEIGNGPYGLI